MANFELIKEKTRIKHVIIAGIWEFLNMPEEVKKKMQAHIPPYKLKAKTVS
jgi:hypothetical protein